jgi:hypothetical protein
LRGRDRARVRPAAPADPAFEERPDGILVRDTVLYRMPYGPVGAIAHRVLVARDLERVFDYRRDAVERLLGGRRSTLAPAGSGG